MSGDGGGAGGRGDEAEQHAQRCGLARPVRPEESDDLPPLDREAEVAYGQCGPEPLCQAMDLDHRGWPSRSRYLGWEPRCRERTMTAPTSTASTISQPRIHTQALLPCPAAASMAKAVGCSVSAVMPSAWPEGRTAVV